MQLYRKSSHTVFDCKYHLVWTTKYHKPVLTGRLGTRTRDLVREICDTHNVQIIKGHISKDHVHLFISMPPQISISKMAQYLKGKTARKVLQENLDEIASDGNLFAKKVAAKEIFGSHLRLGARRVVVSPLVGGSVEPPTQWAALRAAHAEAGQRPLRSILVPGAGLETYSFSTG